MLRNLYRLAGIMLTLVLLAVSCGKAEPTPTPSPLPPVTVSAPATPVFVAGCTTTDLETWLESTYFLTDEFVNVTNYLSTQSPEAVRAGITRLVMLRDAILAVPVPETCAADVHMLITAVVQNAVTALQRYGNDEDIDLAPVVDDVNGIIGNVEALQSNLEEQLQMQRETEQP